jgi:hypothetical protein
MCILTNGSDQEQARNEVFSGVIKSFNARRGFGFVSCEETASRFGRDVYLSKDEASTLATEPSIGHAASDSSEGGGNDKSKTPPVQEGDVLLFEVKLSTEGFPQAVNVRKLRRLRGVVRRAPSSTLDGILIVSGDGTSSAERNSQNPDISVAQLLGAEVRLRQSECGQLQLAPNDEVAFCCTNVADTDGHGLDAQLIELVCTSRSAGSVLGCFSLKLPLFSSNSVQGHQDSDGTKFVEVQGHALTDTVFLSDVPLDLTTADLMRLFGKLGGKDATLTPVNSTLGFSSIPFTGHENVAKFLASATHTVSENGETQLACVGPCLQHKCGICGPVQPPASTESDPAWKKNHEFAQPFTQPACNPSILLASEPRQRDILNIGFSQPVEPLHPSSCGVCLCPPVLPTVPDWRCIHSNIVVSPMAPEIAPCADTTGISIQWPTVIHATAYVVELVNQATMEVQRFTRALTVDCLPALVSLRVDGLMPGMYGACVRCVAPCGCESAASSWSFLTLCPPPAVASGVMSLAPATLQAVSPGVVHLGSVSLGQESSAVPRGPALHVLPPSAPATLSGIVQPACPPPPIMPPFLPLSDLHLSTALPQIPEEVIDEEILTLD